MRAFIAAWLAAVAAPAPAPESYNPVSLVQVRRDGDQWTAEFEFRKDAGAWVFTRSAMTREGTQPWRPLTWTVETPGVELKRLGFYDTLVAKSGSVPRKVRVRFTPYAKDLRADYDPALAFTDGSVALFTGHFNAVPLPTAAAVEKLPSHLGAVDLVDAGPAQLTFSDNSGPVLHGGKRKQSVTMVGEDTYVLFGKANTVEAAAITTIMDPQLPAWIAGELAAFTPRLLSFYSAKLGPRSGEKPAIFVSWAGPTPGLRSMGGSTLPAMIIMRFEGQVFAAPNPAVEQGARWFIAHESAHFWAGQEVHYRSPSEAWITEGGAELLAIRAAAALDPKFDTRSELQRRLDECIALAAKGPISSAGERNEHNVYYSCGAMFGLAAEAAEARHGRDFFGFWRTLIDSNRDDKILDREEWLARLSKASGTAKGAALIASMLDNATPDAAATLAALFDATGVPYGKDDAGKMLLT